MDTWNTFAALAYDWLAYIIHPGGWAWFVCSLVAAIWICSRFVVRPLSVQISNQSENQLQTLKFLRIAVDELRLELKSLSNRSNDDEDLIKAANEQSAPNSAVRAIANATGETLRAEPKTAMAIGSTARRPLPTLR